MSDPLGWFFVKFFTKEEHANQFVRGSLFMNRLSYFKRLESEDNDGRPDATEAVAMWWQPHDLVMDLNIPGIGAVSITKEDLAGPVSMAFEFHGHFHIFCLCTVYTTGFELVDGKLDIAENDLAELRRQLLIDEQWFKFGPYAVVTPVPPFLAQLKEGLRRSGRWFNAGLVEYYNDETFHGEIAPKDIPFRKQKNLLIRRNSEFASTQEQRGTIRLPSKSGISAIFALKLLRGSLMICCNSNWRQRPQPCRHPPEQLEWRSALDRRRHLSQRSWSVICVTA